ncbi:hypothetical protein [Nocardioides sp. GXQ0305]
MAEPRTIGLLGCTRIELLVGPDFECHHVPTTPPHALAAVDAALATGPVR